mmetsp:Transcript_12531/g.45701  ORF Transcript_12531/g.45701 Transcript_12531/m.45701 type:complete len:162 (+) Transcript_12531:197-682(+)
MEGKCRSLQLLGRVGELVHVLRPVAYALAVRRCGRASWRPWLASLAMDLASMTLHAWIDRRTLRAAHADRARVGGGGAEEQGEARLAALRYTAEEREELGRRQLLLVYYLLRSPMYERGLQGLARGAQRALAPVPVARTVVGKGAAILDEVHAYHFHTDAT